MPAKTDMASSAATTNCKGGVADFENEEMDPVSNTSRELAILAEGCFSEGSFSDSLSHLMKLQEQRPLDTRFAHNSAVVEFYISELRNIGEFSKKLNSVCSLGDFNLDNIESLDDVRNCYVYFNKATLLYHSMQYTSALKIANKVFTFIELMDAELRQAVSLLLIELFLCVYQPDKALSVISFVENLAESDATALKTNSTEIENTVNEDQKSDAKYEAFKTRLEMYKCRCYLSTRNCTFYEKEMENLSNNHIKMVNKSGLTNEKTYDARCHSVKCCAKFLKAHVEYLRGNLKSCMHILSTISLKNNVSLTGDATTLAFYNNMGCAHLSANKANLASLYFRKALQENEKNLKEMNSVENENRNWTLFNRNSSKLPELMYNLGVSLLHSGKPAEAFDCLTLAVQVYHTNPRLWLRLAECCIMVHTSGNDKDFDFINKRKDVLQEVMGTGTRRKLLLKLNLFENKQYSYDAQSFAIPVASLEFATLCLRNSLLLLSETTTTTTTTTAMAASSTVDCSPSNPITASQVANLRDSVLVASAYVSLCLGDPIVALNSCKNLFSMGNCCGVNKMLAHLYIAEAYILLDRIPEALEHLKPDYGNYVISADEKESPNWIKSWKPDSSTSARAVFQYNLAVVLALQGELLKAADLLKQVWLTKGPQCEIPVQIISLVLYIELSLGHADIARNIIKQNCHQYSNLTT